MIASDRDGNLLGFEPSRTEAHLHVDDVQVARRLVSASAHFGYRSVVFDTKHFNDMRTVDIITPDKARTTARDIVRMMSERYSVLEQHGVNHYTKLPAYRMFHPVLVVVNGGEHRELAETIAVFARSAGVHLILVGGELHSSNREGFAVLRDGTFTSSETGTVTVGDVYSM